MNHSTFFLSTYSRSPPTPNTIKVETQSPAGKVQREQALTGQDRAVRRTCPALVVRGSTRGTGWPRTWLTGTLQSLAGREPWPTPAVAASSSAVACGGKYRFQHHSPGSAVGGLFISPLVSHRGMRKLNCH